MSTHKQESDRVQKQECDDLEESEKDLEHVVVQINVLLYHLIALPCSLSCLTEPLPES